MCEILHSAKKFPVPRFLYQVDCLGQIDVLVDYEHPGDLLCVCVRLLEVPCSHNAPLCNKEYIIQ